MTTIIQKLKNKFRGESKSERSTAQTPEWTDSAAWPLQDKTLWPSIHTQENSPLFEKLSPELRILVYKEVLCDPELYLHICANTTHKPYTKGRKVAHYRCTDPHSPFPTWQHACFGEKTVKMGYERRFTTETEDRLLSLLLTCRRTYFEALEILYRYNTFHFRGGLSLPVFRTSIPRIQWEAIRHLHIATGYSPFLNGPFLFVDIYPPLTLPNWPIICSHLKELPNIETLNLEIAVRDENAHYNFEFHKTTLLMSILEPLKTLRIQIMLELNVEVHDEIWEMLGPVNFLVTFKERPDRYNFFRATLLHDAVEVIIYPGQDDGRPWHQWQRRAKPRYPGTNGYP